MGFVSDLTGQLVIDDSNAHQYASKIPDGMSKGYEARDWEAEPYGSLGYAAPFNIPLIPRSEWTDRIEAMERTKTRVSDMRRQAGLKCTDQNGTNYCWCHGVVNAMRLIRAMNGQPFVDLSPASAAAPIKSYRNQGGWGGQAVEYIAEHGVASTEFWPANKIDRRYFEPSRENASLHKITEWYELQNNNFDQLMTCLLLRIPTAIGLNWWSHLVCAMDPVVMGKNAYGTRILNSWGSGWGDDGEGVLVERKSLPSDGMSPRTVSPSTV